jgi:hypothetical protein
MTICFFDSKGIVQKELVPPGKLVNQHFYLKVLDRSGKRNIRVRLKSAKMWILHRDNAPCHRTFSVSRFFPQAPYSLDMPPCDFLFPQIKLYMKGTNFESITDIQTAMTKVLVYYYYNNKRAENHIFICRIYRTTR